MAASAPANTTQIPAQSDPDPLLRPGSFIAPNGQGLAAAAAATAAATATAAAAAAAATPVVTPEKGKRKAPEGDLDWLPKGWTVEDRVRTSGVTAGSVDRYYYDPVSARKFRSKKEVLYFLETGTPRKKSKPENSDAGTPTTDKPQGPKQKPHIVEKKGSAANFNFSKVPEKVQWVLSDSSAESWSAFIGDKKVPDSSKLDWLAAFTFLASKDRGRYH